MSQVGVPNSLKKWWFGDLVRHARWPKVTDAAIEADFIANNWLQVFIITVAYRIHTRELRHVQ